jgi:DNA-binding transcriptional MocR family regulator
MMEHYAIRGRTATEIAASVEAGIRSGRFPPGSQLPPVRSLATQLGRSTGTVAAAYKSLQARGLIMAGGRRGTTVRARPAVGLRAQPAPPLPAGTRDLSHGNMDPRLLPDLTPVLHRLDPGHATYVDPPVSAELLALAAERFASDGVPTSAITVVSGALGGIERVLTTQLAPGDHVAVEDPGYANLLDLIAALGLHVEPVAIDEEGPLPQGLDRALRRGAQAAIITCRAQNPTGAALTPARADGLREVLHAHPDVLLIQDDNAAEVSGAPLAAVAVQSQARWVLVRSVSKTLGPDLRLALLTGDETTIARVEGRQRLGPGWVSHLLQRATVALWRDPGTAQLLARAEARYTERRQALLAALAEREIPATGRTGLNVWVGVSDERETLARLLTDGWLVAAGERFRIASPTAVRVTTAALEPAEAPQLAAALAAAMRPHRRAYGA